MRTQKKGTRSLRFRITTIAIAVASSFAMAPAWAADTATGNGNGVAYGTGSNAPKAENIAIGKGATIAYSGGVGQPSTGDIVIGSGAHTNNYIDQGGGIAIGSNSFVENMVGGLERSFDFKQAGYNSIFGISTGLPKDPTKMVTGIAIGQNTYGRSGSVMLGTHNYKGKLGDVDVDSSSTKDNNMLLFSTTLGANSYSNGLFSSVTGAYSIASSNYSGSNTSAATKNFGATITGSLNSIESATASSAYSGVANSIVGTANRTFNSNGSLIFGAGNEITNSVANIAAPSSGGDSAKDLADSLRKTIKDSNGGGATLAIGGGNTADYTQASQLIGVNNTLTGTSDYVSQYNALNGYKNTATNVKQTYITGLENTVDNSLQVKVLGDNNTVSKSNYQTVIGDSNSIKNRDAGTNSGKSRTNPDLWIGTGNSIDGNNTYQYGYETLKTIGNHNKYINASSGIAIGDYQTIAAAEESIVIGSMSPDEQADETTEQKANSVVIGYHTQSGSRDSGGLNVVLGNRAKAYGWVQTVTGIGSVAGIKDDWSSGYLATSYGALNKIDGTESFANSVVGTLNKTDDAAGALVLGSGNTISHSSLDVVSPELAQMVEFNSQYLALGNSSFLDYDTTVDIMGRVMSAGGGSVSTIGHGNTADYASLSQIFGSGNILKGKTGNISERNTISGSYNTGTSIKNTSLIGTGNTVSSSQSDVVIGDYHTLSGGGNNVVIGSMEAQDQQEEKTVNGVSYTITKKVPVKAHQSDISDTVMIGHNADVTVNGGVALGANSVASTDKGVAGYDLSTGAASTETSVAWKSTAAAVSVGDVHNGVTRQITGVAAGLDDTDAVNVAQLKKAASAATTTVNTTDPNMTVAEQPADSHNYTVGLNKNLTGMESAEFGTAGTSVTKISKDGLKIVKDDTTVQLTSGGLDNGGQTITNVYAGSNDTDAVNVRQLKDSRSKVESGDPSYVTVGVRKEDSANNSGATIYSVALTTDADDAITKANHYLTATGINAQGDKITNVAPGTISATSTDAVNGSQLYQTNQAVQQNSDDISKLYNRSAELNRKIHRAGAHAAALAALHPLDFDENHRVSASLGLGQYHSSGAAALGIFVRPTENFMVSLGGSIASGSDVMGNLGVHYRFGGDSVRVNKTELTQQVSTLTAENRDLSAKLASSNSKLEAATSKIDSLMERIHAIEAKLNMK